MATNIPRNLGEVIDAVCALIDDPYTDERLMEIVPGRFSTGDSGSVRQPRDRLMTGRGSVVMRGRVNIEHMAKDREAIIVTEVPYQVNKAAMIENSPS